MKLKVYQQGGGLIYTPFIPGRTQSTFSGSSSNDGDDSKIDPLDKEILGLMKDQNLLPSDIQAISTALINFQKQTQHLGNPITGGSNNYRSVMPGMLQIMNMVSVARHNREFWNDKLTEIQKHDAGSEVAMDSYGRMWVQDLSNGKLTKIETSKFDKEKYNPVSNSQLMYLRQREYGFGDNILGEGGMDVIGAKDLREEIDAIINEFGKVTAEQYIPGNMQELASDIKEKGIFKVGQERSKGELNDFSGLLYSQLGSSAQHLLNARAALTGYSPIEYLQSIIFSNIDKKDTISYDASLSKAAGLAGTGGNSGNTSLKQDTYQIRFANGEGGTQVTVSLVPAASKISDKSGLIIQGLDYGPMLDFDQLPLEPMTLQRMLFTGGKKASALATSVRSSDVTFGTKLLDETELPAIMYNNRSLTTKVYLPYEERNGHFTPNFKVIEGFNKYKKARKDNPNLSTTERNALLQQCGLNPDDLVEKPDGTIELKRTMPFLTFSAYAGDDTIKFTSDEERYLAKVDRSKGRIIADMYNNAIAYDSTYTKKNADKIRKTYGKSEAGDFWEGLVFIPVPDSTYAYNNTSNQYISPEEFNDVAARNWANNIEKELRIQAETNPNYEEYSKLGQW